jgi:uncharacterized protein RhaS with RHS repeats
LIGLYFYRGRYYDPVVGRFINEDPISFAGGDVNLYRYVGNSPVNATDPMGWFAIAWPVFEVIKWVLVWVFIVGVGWVLQRQQQIDPPLVPPIDPPLPPPPIPIPNAPSIPSPNPGCKNERGRNKKNRKKKSQDPAKTCANTSPYSSYAKCIDLDTQQGERYVYDTAEEAYDTLVSGYKTAGNTIGGVTKISGSGTRSLGADANKGPCALAIYGTSHWNVLDKNRSGNQSIGSITRCECCYDTPTGPKIRSNFRNYAIFPKQQNWRPYN